MYSKLEIRKFAKRDEQDVAGYAELMDLVFSSWQDILFSENQHLRMLVERGTLDQHGSGRGVWYSLH